MSNVEWYYMHHPAKGWECIEVDGTWTLVPKLKKLKAKPGVNGCKVVNVKGQRRVSVAHTVTMMQARGYNVQPFINRTDEYRQKVPGVGFISKFAEVKRLGNQVRIRKDVDADIAWRISLMEDGTIEPPDPDFLDDMLKVQKARARRGANLVHIPQHAAKVEREQERLEGMQKAIAAIGEDEPKPKPKRKRKKAKSA